MLCSKCFFFISSLICVSLCQFLLSIKLICNFSSRLFVVIVVVKVGIQIQHGMMVQEIPVKHRSRSQAMPVVVAITAVVLVEITHGILMHLGIKANKTMHTLPLRVINLIKCRPVHRMPHRIHKRKSALCQHRNSTSQKTRKHRKSSSIH